MCTNWLCSCTRNDAKNIQNSLNIKVISGEINLDFATILCLNFENENKSRQSRRQHRPSIQTSTQTMIADCFTSTQHVLNVDITYIYVSFRIPFFQLHSTMYSKLFLLDLNI